jgi:hypothetical protein
VLTVRPDSAPAWALVLAPVLAAGDMAAALRLRVLVPGGDPLAEVFLQSLDRPMVGALEQVLDDEAEEPFDLVESRRIGRAGWERAGAWTWDFSSTHLWRRVQPARFHTPAGAGAASGLSGSPPPETGSSSPASSRSPDWSANPSAAARKPARSPTCCAPCRPVGPPPDSWPAGSRGAGRSRACIDSGTSCSAKTPRRSGPVRGPKPWQRRGTRQSACPVWAAAKASQPASGTTPRTPKTSQTYP